jgi:hypothetical protein
VFVYHAESRSRGGQCEVAPNKPLKRTSRFVVPRLRASLVSPS